MVVSHNPQREEEHHRVPQEQSLGKLLEVVDNLHQGEQGSHQQVGNLEQGGSLQEQGDIPHQEQEGSLHREQEDNQDQGDIHQFEDILDIPDKI